MHALIVHCHPEPASFNMVLTEVARTTLRQWGNSVEVSDLYREAFDPCERSVHYQHRENGGVFSPLREQRNAFKTNTLPEDRPKRDCSAGTCRFGGFSVPDLVARSPGFADSGIIARLF